jgi:Na+-transporting methylmalonyl-CoA/oxaloacetate decarboxylase beta subunit
MTTAQSIGIIGGADGPTAIFITGRFPWGLLLIGIVCIVIVIRYVRKKK